VVDNVEVPPDQEKAVRPAVICCPEQAIVLTEDDGGTPK
jgi:ferredoxin